MEQFLPMIAAVTAVGGFVVVCLKIRNGWLKGRNLAQEHRNLEQGASKPGPKVVQNAGRNAIYIDQSQHHPR